mgnify:FL=1
MKTVTHVIADPLGLHARPAGLLVKLAGDFESAIVVTTSTGTADAKRIMALMRLGAKQGTLLTVTCSGPDEEAAAEAIRRFLTDHL